MPKVFGFLSRLSSKSLSVPATGPDTTKFSRKKSAHRFRSRHRKSFTQKMLIARSRRIEIEKRKRAKLLQAAKTKTIKNDYLKLILEEAQDQYQASLAAQRAVSAANLHRERGDMRDGVVEVDL